MSNTMEEIVYSVLKKYFDAEWEGICINGKYATPEEAVAAMLSPQELEIVEILLRHSTISFDFSGKAERAKEVEEQALKEWSKMNDRK